MSLYLSPIGGSPAHPKAESPTDTRVKTATAGKAKGSLKQKAHSSKSAVAVKTVTRSSPGGKIVRDVVYLPSSASKSGAATTTITPVPAPSSSTTPTTTTTTTTTSPHGELEPSPCPPRVELVAPHSDYWGVSINGVPQGTSQLNALDAAVEEAPSELTWYQGWDEPYPAQTVQSSWQHGALPMITWESKPSQDTDPAQSDPAYSLSDIINGNYDAYLQAFADAVTAEGLPVVIRLDQEMNGNWFPWSEGLNGNTSGQYVEMWRHVWNIFQAAGANNYVIWLWAPNRVDNLTNPPALSELYPGDSYVDWIGVDAYLAVRDRSTNLRSRLQRVVRRPGCGVGQADLHRRDGGDRNGPDNRGRRRPREGAIHDEPPPEHRVRPTDRRVLVVRQRGHLNLDGIPITNDWRIDSDPANLFAFKSAIATGPFTAGLMPSSNTPELTVAPPGGG